ncbi:hypothetical protein CMEL01_11155 [Colletotrichum melonis]|uniref:Uncharacterized protein n=4 Tax=Colletotrichum acutatum species complex TaxID=2707335 RepID=A0AAI9Y1D8_9PEZI|nr:hypothetical protein CMEL01_11155 [Colletotrichum melonis]
MSRCPHFQYGIEPGVGLIIWAVLQTKEKRKGCGRKAKRYAWLGSRLASGWARSVD